VARDTGYEPDCNRRCIRKRDRGFLDPWNVAVGDTVIEPDPDCPVHGGNR
jgi:hypothetical protein